MSQNWRDWLDEDNETNLPKIVPIKKKRKTEEEQKSSKKPTNHRVSTEK